VAGRLIERPTTWRDSTGAEVTYFNASSVARRIRRPSATRSAASSSCGAPIVVIAAKTPEGFQRVKPAPAYTLIKIREIAV
jgi:hypothetical protein